MWQNATNIIRKTLNLTENQKKLSLLFVKTAKSLGPIKIILRRFPTKNLQTFNRHCEECEIAFHMDIVKLMAKHNKHHQNNFELDRKSKKTNVFLPKRQKLVSNKSTIVTLSDKKLTNFQSSLQRV